MTDMNATWDPSSALAWAKALGLVHVPLFASGREPESYGECAILLDGQKSSFATCSIGDDSCIYADEPQSWSWSSNVRHTLILHPDRHEMFLRRWDSPEYRRFRFPQRPGSAQELLAVIEGSGPPRGIHVILHMLRAFRRLRASLMAPDGLEAIRVFNALLIGTEAVRRGTRSEGEWLRCRSVGDALDSLGEDLLSEAEVCGLSQSTRDAVIGDLLALFVHPEPTTGCRLEPDLLLRHAAGELYQEAHLMIERSQPPLPGWAGGDRLCGALRRDVRFTPAPLARMLVQQALESKEARGPCRLDVLDPACGSGIFLQETLRELEAGAFKGQVSLRGFDVSPISCAIARFCLARAKREAKDSGMVVEVDIKQADALQTPWGTPDMILMNPPFVSWQGMDPQDREAVTQILGTLRRGRVDKAMAFIWKAARELKEGAVLASVLPSALLETEAGEKWREALSQRADLCLLGRLQGYRLFKGSFVEPGFLVLTRKGEGDETRRRPVKVVLASEGAEDAAIRALRLHDRLGLRAEETGWEVLEAPPDSLSPASWLPRSGRYLRLVEDLSNQGMPTVADLFVVRQGAKTGRDETFILSEGELQTLPQKERDFFRPVAGSSTIGQGVIHPTRYLFSPYGEAGLLLENEDKLKSLVPTYYAGWLYPAKERLAGRCRAPQERWWALTRERSWQHGICPKLVTKSFGERGSFAYDETGRFAVVQGCAWVWRGENGSFHGFPLPWAYLALLNTLVFENLLACYCPRVQGGQFNLSKRFVERVFLPNLADHLHVSGDAVRELARFGREMHAGNMPAEKPLERIAGQLYGLDVEAMQRGGEA